MKWGIPRGFYDLGNLVVSRLQGIIKTKTRQHIREIQKQQRAEELAGDRGVNRRGFVTIKDGHGGYVIWMCAAGQRRGRHHDHVWVYIGGQSHRI
jgi:hypothetical protein